MTLLKENLEQAAPLVVEFKMALGFGGLGSRVLRQAAQIRKSTNTGGLSPNSQQQGQGFPFGMFSGGGSLMGSFAGILQQPQDNGGEFGSLDPFAEEELDPSLALAEDPNMGMDSDIFGSLDGTMPQQDFGTEFGSLNQFRPQMLQQMINQRFGRLGGLSLEGIF